MSFIEDSIPKQFHIKDIKDSNDNNEKMDLELNTRYGAELTMTTDNGQLVETIYNRETNINSDVINSVSNVLLDMLEAYTGKEYYDPELLTKLTSNCFIQDGYQGLKDILMDLDIDLEEFSEFLKQ